MNIFIWIAIYRLKFIFYRFNIEWKVQIIKFKKKYIDILKNIC